MRHASHPILTLALAGVLSCSGGGLEPNGSGNGPSGTGDPGLSSGGPNGSGSGSAGAGGSAAPNTNFGKGGASGGTGGPTAMKNCGLQTIPLKRQPAELLLVLDRSGSMTETLRGAGQKWMAMTDALNSVLMRTQGGVYWGLKLFPSDMMCGVNDGVNVDVALNNYPPINGAVTMNPPIQNGGSTPTAVAVGKAATYMAARKTPNPKYLLLATDGLPNCAGGRANANDPAGAVQSVANAAMLGLHTFVVGIATQGSTADTTLNQMADRGLEPRNGTPHYYPVASRDEFVNVLDSITGQISSCTFPLTQAPPSPDDVAVNADSMRVPRDKTHMSGWDYAADGKSIVLFGMWCDKLKSGAVKDVQIIFGCPGMLIP